MATLIERYFYGKANQNDVFISVSIGEFLI